MARDPEMRRPPHPALIALVLLAFVVIGLAAGFGARQLVNGGGVGGPVARATNTANSQRATATNTANATSTSTSVATIVPPSGFSLSLDGVSPNSVAPGQKFTVVVAVLAPGGATPLAGVLCKMGPPQDGGSPLFQQPSQWPAPQVSNAQGEAIWSVQAPTLPAGAYAFTISATGAGDYIYHVDGSITITG